MLLLRLFILFLLILWTGVGLAGQAQEMELTDGSVISGEILSLNGGTYILRSESLGTLSIPQSKVRAIRSLSSANTRTQSRSSSHNPAPGQIQDMQQMMTGNTDIMNMIHSLQNDPELQRILEDPILMEAVRSGDITALEANPQFRKLLTNPTISDITGKVK